MGRHQNKPAESWFVTFAVCTKFTHLPELPTVHDTITPPAATISPSQHCPTLHHVKSHATMGYHLAKFFMKLFFDFTDDFFHLQSVP